MLTLCPPWSTPSELAIPGTLLLERREASTMGVNWLLSRHLYSEWHHSGVTFWRAGCRETKNARNTKRRDLTCKRQWCHSKDKRMNRSQRGGEYGWCWKVWIEYFTDECLLIFYTRHLEHLNLVRVALCVLRVGWHASKSSLSTTDSPSTWKKQLSLWLEEYFQIKTKAREIWKKLDLTYLSLEVSWQCHPGAGIVCQKL